MAVVVMMVVIVAAAALLILMIVVVVMVLMVVVVAAAAPFVLMMMVSLPYLLQKLSCHVVGGLFNDLQKLGSGETADGSRNNGCLRILLPDQLHCLCHLIGVCHVGTA